MRVLEVTDLELEHPDSTHSLSPERGEKSVTILCHLTGAVQDQPLQLTQILTMCFFFLCVPTVESYVSQQKAVKHLLLKV